MSRWRKSAITPTGGDERASAALPRQLDILQVYRGIAATLVVLFHLTYWGGPPAFLQLPLWTPMLPTWRPAGLFRSGGSGVDFFFTLSGFVMVWGYGSDAGNIRRLWPFLRSRMTRIYPTYWVVLALTLLYYYVRPGVADHTMLEAGALARGFALYGTGPWQVPPSGTLAFELALYSCFAALFVVGRTLFSAAAVLWCGAIIAQWNGWYTVGDHPILLSPSMLEFFFGALGAVYIRAYRPRGSGVSLAVVAVLCVTVGVISSVEQAQGYSDSFRNFALPYALLIVTGVSYELSGQRRYPRLLMLLGDASFSIYLTHYYLIWELNGKMSQYGMIARSIGYDGQRMVVLVLVLAFGVGFWAVVERPLLARLHRKTPR